MSRNADIRPVALAFGIQILASWFEPGAEAPSPESFAVVVAALAWWASRRDDPPEPDEDPA